MSEFPLTGGCNCGAVRFEVSEPMVVASYCHCKRCQRRSGTAASASAHPTPGTFQIVAGEDRLRVWKPDDGGEKWFCGDCGSSLFGRNPNHPDPIGIRMGTLDRDPGIRPSVRQFVAMPRLGSRSLTTDCPAPGKPPLFQVDPRPPLGQPGGTGGATVDRDSVELVAIGECGDERGTCRDVCAAHAIAAFDNETVRIEPTPRWFLTSSTRPGPSSAERCRCRR